MQGLHNDDLLLLTRAMGAATLVLRRRQGKWVDPIRLGVLQLAWEHQSMRPSEMAKELQVSASSITRQAQALHAAGTIVLTEDPTDRRGYLISLTEQGHAEFAAIERHGAELLGEDLADWDPDKVHILSLLLSRLAETLGRNHMQRQQHREASGQLTA